MPAPVLQIKRGLLANLPGLRAGEPGFTTDSYDLYVGLTSETSTNKFFGSHRYWTKETTSTGSGINLVEGTDNGSDYITIKSPNSLAGIVTYTLPGTQGASSSVLTNDGSGNLTWSSGSDSPVFTGIATFTDTTDNTLGNADTGAVQIDGGLGVNKNVTIGANLNVQGYSEFVGVATFKGGTITLGDSDNDNINVVGEFISNLVPNTDNTYDIGNGGASKRWRHASFSGIGTFATGLIGDSVRLGIGGAGSVDTTTGNLTLDSASGLTFVNDNLEVQGNVDIDYNLNVDGHSELDDVNVSGGINVTGVSTFSADVIVGGNLYVNGSTTQVNTTELTVYDRTITLGIQTGSTPSTTTWDLGVLMNYGDAGVAKTAGVIWEYGNERFVFSANSDNPSSSSTSTPNITVSAFAPIEIGALWVNDCAGQSQVISCTGTERFLENITVDGGAY